MSGLRCDVTGSSPGTACHQTAAPSAASRSRARCSHRVPKLVDAAFRSQSRPPDSSPSRRRHSPRWYHAYRRGTRDRARDRDTRGGNPPPARARRAGGRPGRAGRAPLAGSHRPRALWRGPPRPRRSPGERRIALVAQGMDEGGGRVQADRQLGVAGELGLGSRRSGPGRHRHGRARPGAPPAPCRSPRPPAGSWPG